MINGGELDKMQVLIIGASSFIGNHIFQYCQRKGICVIGTYYRKKINDEYIFFDMHKQAFSDLLEKIPDAIYPENAVAIICSADASIDSCKINEENSYKLNVQKTKELLNDLGRMKIKTVFFSSEAVFDGKKGMYSEEDSPNPITVYGRQKYEIEKYITSKLKDALVFRISRAVGSSFGERDIFNEFYEKIQHDEKIICLKDQSFCLTEVEDIATAVISAVSRGLKGIYHISSGNYITRYELATRFSKELCAGAGIIEERNFDEIGFADNRHIKGGLDGTRLRSVLDLEYMDLNSIIRKYKNTMLKKCE